MANKEKQRKLFFFYGNGDESGSARSIVRNLGKELERIVEIVWIWIDDDDGWHFEEPPFSAYLPSIRIDEWGDNFFTVDGVNKIEYFLRKLIDNPDKDVYEAFNICCEEKWGRKEIKNRIFFFYGDGKESKRVKSYMQGNSSRLMSLGIEVIELHFPVNEEKDYIAMNRLPSIHFNDDLSSLLFGRKAVLGEDKIRYFLDKLIKNPDGNLLIIFNACEREGWGHRGQ
jgi:hypothetical protein